MKRCPHCGQEDHDEAMLCKNCMRSFSASPIHLATPSASLTTRYLRRFVMLGLMAGAAWFLSRNPALFEETIRNLQRPDSGEEARDTREPSPATSPKEAPATATQRGAEERLTPAVPPPSSRAEAPPPPAASETPSRGEPPPSRPRAKTERPAPAARQPSKRETEPVKSALPTTPAEPARSAAPAPSEPPPPAAKPEASGRPVRVGGQIKPPNKIRDVPPQYPAIAQASRVQGLVIIEATIGTDGRVQNTRILRSIALLDDAALEAVRQWVFEPTLLNGVAVPVIMTVTVNFSLK